MEWKEKERKSFDSNDFYFMNNPSNYHNGLVKKVRFSSVFIGLVYLLLVH